VQPLKIGWHHDLAADGKPPPLGGSHLEKGTVGAAVWQRFSRSLCSVSKGPPRPCRPTRETPPP